MRKPITYDAIAQALRETAKLYRKSRWDNAGAYVEARLEKDALSASSKEE